MYDDIVRVHKCVSWQHIVCRVVVCNEFLNTLCTVLRYCAYSEFEYDTTTAQIVASVEEFDIIEECWSRDRQRHFSRQS